MIGVISKTGQTEVVEEFFELFKTPWEYYRPGITYEAVIATADELPVALKSRLLLVFGAAAKSADAGFGFSVGGRKDCGVLRDRDGMVPIYTGLLTFEPSDSSAACVTNGGERAGIRASSAQGTVIRLGYDLFDEVAFLLSTGQPIEHAEVPTLEIHIRMVREWILDAGILLLEIPPVPADHSFIVCLTHDIDFISVRQHFMDHSMWGFVFRATVGALWKFIRGRLRFSHLWRNWLAAGSLPFVQAGWARDFWEPFGWYSKVEEGLSPTYFLIPYKRRPGDRVPGRHASRRATAYDVTDLRKEVEVLRKSGCEVGVHGIDSWHDAQKGWAERAAVASVAGECFGIRMHWLLRDENTPVTLERAGYRYDSTFGYNEAVGYRAGTVQVFRPFGANALLELPLHIQDGALFYPQRLDLTEPEAEKRCQVLINHSKRFGGVLTLLWHDRSHGPERFWGEFYQRLIQTLRPLGPWFATGEQATDWFRKRRSVRFEVNSQDGASVKLVYEGEEIQPPLRIRVNRPSGAGLNCAFTETPWDGRLAPEGELCQQP